LPVLPEGQEGGGHQYDVVQVDRRATERSGRPAKAVSPHRLVASIAFFVFSRARWT
jgi:hypothetical protein